MKHFRCELAIAILVFSQIAAMGQTSMLPLGDPATLPPAPSTAVGYPSRAANLDIQSQFAQPPAGYGEIPFWWWSGDPLDKKRMDWQLEQLHKMGISGVQVNYCHKDTKGWPTYLNTPEIFTDSWWDFYSHASQTAGKYNMGIGLSTYTLDWNKSDNLFNRIVYNDPEFNACSLSGRQIAAVKMGDKISLARSGNHIAFAAYELNNNMLSDGWKIDEPDTNEALEYTGASPRPLSGKDNQLVIWEFTWSKNPGTINPIHPESGQRVIDKYFQPFEDHNPGKTAKGLNYFFNDELNIGCGGWQWAADFPEQFKIYKGYDFYSKAPALFGNSMGNITPKVRMDYNDVQIYLAEQRYFKPIYLWHYTRGMTYGCDNNGRGLQPTAYGDYYRIIRWYSAPGHDTPGGYADFLKDKVSSSIANVYQRPRVWLEGYHSLGWGATPDRLMYATNENFVYGCTLLNLHGLYYTTHGSYWEWAPPCYHFRMPYWEHFGTFLKYFERLSFVFSQGTLQSDIAIMYPTSPSMAGLGQNQQQATKTAFDAAKIIYNSGRDITFLDDQSVLRATIKPATTIAPAKLCVSGIEFSVYVLPSVEAVRWDVLNKLRDFQKAGGKVVCIGQKPTISDRAGENDPELNQLVNSMFPEKDSADWTTQIASFPQDVKGTQAVKYLHRKIGNKDLYMILGARKNVELSFRVTGIPARWDAMTGKIFPMIVTGQQDGYTTVQMPLESNQATVIAFTPGQATITDLKTLPAKTVEKMDIAGAWGFKLLPTMNNQFGDFRLPITEDNKLIGAEARRFKFRSCQPNEDISAMLQSDYNDSSWEQVTGGFGQQFWINSTDANTKLDINKLPNADSRNYRFSWQLGIEGNPGHQGYHGLKKNINDNFIALGSRASGLNEQWFRQENPAKRYYLTSWFSFKGEATVQKGGILPCEVYLDGNPISLETKTINLTGKKQKLVLVYASAGRGFWFLEKGVQPQRTAQKEAADIPAGDNTRPEIANPTPLSMSWFDCDYVPFSAVGEQQSLYRFKAPAGLKSMVITTSDLVIQAPAVFVNGQAIPVTKTASQFKRSQRFTAVLPQTESNPAVVVIKAAVPEGIEAGSYFPQPIKLETEQGTINSLGDWSKDGTILDTYSGGAVYSKTITVSDPQAASKSTILNLGKVAATAEVKINGVSAGVLVASPWTIDITGLLKSGDNKMEITVYNTLSNNYQTIPSNYRGDNTSGLIGPVSISFEN